MLRFQGGSLPANYIWTKILVHLQINEKDEMRLEIKELGAIKRAEFDLGKKLTIFCGPNGTGKTYAAFLIYALARLENRNLGYRLNANLLNLIITENRLEYPLDLEELWAFKTREVKSLEDRLGSIFAVADSKVNDFFAKTEISLLESKDDFFERIIKLKLDLKIRLYQYEFHFIKESGASTILVHVGEDTTKDEQYKSFLDIVFTSRLYSILAFHPLTSSAIFPVERNSIYTFSNELSIRRNEALEHLQALSTRKDLNLMDLFFKRSSRYPQPIRDELQVSEDLDNVQKKNSEFFDFASQIENELLKGKVAITKEGNVEFSSQKAPKLRLSFHQSSSIVKTLASLVIYLKHRALKNDLVIIDEPELNLHPDNQVKLARIFAKMVNKGLRLVISTHSDYFIREFNNLIMLSSEDQDLKNSALRYGYDPDEKLFVDEVGAYFFDFKNKNAKQVDVKAISIDQFGFEVSTFDETIEQLNLRSDDFYYTLKYGKAEE